MAVNRSEIKAFAREKISGNILTFFGLSVVFFLILGVSSFTYIGTIVLTGPLCLGAAMFVLEMIRKDSAQFGTGFEGFKQFGSSLVALLLMYIFIFLWTLLLVFPGIIAAYRYSMTYYILADNPKMSGFDAIKKSKEIMKGHKMELFVLQLSFIGWALLCLITAGLAGIYAAPYYYASHAAFYEKIKGSADAE